jgi:hypothetical protein
MTDTRIVDCWGCGGDGGWDEPAGYGPEWFRCPYCEGKGEVEIEAVARTEEDMDAEDAQQ